MRGIKYWTDFTRNPFMWITGEPIIGTNTWIGPFTVIDGSGGLEIGDHCSISAGVHIYTHEMQTPGTGINAEIKRNSVTIGNGVYIGANAVIMMGAIVEDNAIIGAGSVITRNSHVKRGETWVGVPAIKIKEGNTERSYVK